MRNLKKKIKPVFSFFMLLVLNIYLTRAAAIRIEQAKIVAENFLKSKTGITSCKANLHYQQTEPDGSVNFYIFNFLSQKAFVIVTGDNRVKPIIAYSTERSFDIVKAAKSGVSWWMNKMQIQMQGVRTNNFQPEPAIVQQWNSYLGGGSIMNVQSAVVGPLLTSEWGQGSDFNNLCPPDTTGGECPVGCVAVAMAQVMKYWSYPPHGTGSHTDIDNNGLVTGGYYADFENTNYNWENMIDTILGNNDIATLMYHCGVSVDMDYEISESAAWLSWGIIAPGVTAREAMMNNFGYQQINGQARANLWTNAAWINMLKNDLDLNRPIIYSGNGSSGGHAWVIDGYDNNDLFHMNWGWGGDNNDYYDINNFHPDSADYDNFEFALTEIRPSNLSTCNPHYILSGSQSNDYYSWQASDYIKSSKLINNKSCTYTANNYISLSSGFEAKGSDINLNVEIKPCITPRFEGNPSINIANVTVEQNLSVFPNPAHQIVNICYLGSENSTYQIALINMLGQTVKTLNGNSVSGKNIIEISLGEFTKGVYQLLFMQDEKREVKKLVIE